MKRAAIAWTLSIAGVLSAWPIAANAEDRSRPQEEVSLHGIGDLPGGRTESCAIAISPDGQFVTGWSAAEGGVRAFLWTDGSMIELAGDGLTPSVGHAVSRNGGVVVGLAQTASGTTAFRWQDGRAVALPLPPGKRGPSDAWGVSDDGQIVVGHLSDSGRNEAIRWENSGISSLTEIANANSAATAVSSDGSVVVGTVSADRGSEAVLWRGGSMTRLGFLREGGGFSEARSISENGAIVVGQCSSIHGKEACRWSGNQWIPLGSLSREHEFLSIARGVSKDGAVIVGSAIDDRDASQAAVWYGSDGIRSLASMLTSDFGVDLKGWRLEAAMGVSGDGRTIVGCGRNPQGEPEGWIVRLPQTWWRETSVPYAVPGFTRPQLGRGTSVFSGLSEPNGAAIDREGNFYIADTGHNLVRVFNPEGVLKQTWGAPGSGLRFGSPHDVVVSKEGVVYVVDSGHHRVHAVSSDGRLKKSWGGRGSALGLLNRPEGIAVRGQHVYVADTGNDRVQVFDARGECLREQAHLWAFGRFGHGDAELNHPTDLSVHEDGRVFVADTGNHRVCVFDSQGTWIKDWGEKGPTPGLLNRPTGIECIGNDVYVVDQANHRVQVFSSEGSLLYVWGRPLLRPHEAHGRVVFPARIAIAPNQTKALICETSEDRCQAFGIVARPTNPSKTTGTFSDAGPLFQVAAALDVQGEWLMVTDDAADHAWVYRLNGQGADLVTKVGISGHGFGQLSGPKGICFDKTTSNLMISDTGNRRIQVFEFQPPGREVRDFVPNLAKLRKTLDVSGRAESTQEATKNTPLRPGAMAFHSEGILAVIDELSDGVVLYDRDLREIMRLGAVPESDGALGRPVAVAFGRDGASIFVLDAERAGVVVFDRQGNYTHAWGKRGIGTGEFLLPGGMEAGHDGFVYVSDRATHRIQKFDEEGRFILQWGRQGVGAGEFHKPREMGQDAKGRLCVNDFGNQRIQVFNQEGRFLFAIGSPLAIHPTRINSVPP